MPKSTAPLSINKFKDILNTYHLPYNNASAQLMTANLSEAIPTADALIDAFLSVPNKHHTGFLQAVGHVHLKAIIGEPLNKFLTAQLPLRNNQIIFLKALASVPDLVFVCHREDWITIASCMRTVLHGLSIVSRLVDKDSPDVLNGPDGAWGFFGEFEDNLSDLAIHFSLSKQPDSQLHPIKPFFSRISHVKIRRTLIHRIFNQDPNTLEPIFSNEFDARTLCKLFLELDPKDWPVLLKNHQSPAMTTAFLKELASVAHGNTNLAKIFIENTLELLDGSLIEEHWRLLVSILRQTECIPYILSCLKNKDPALEKSILDKYRELANNLSSLINTRNEWNITVENLMWITMVWSILDTKSIDENICVAVILAPVLVPILAIQLVLSLIALPFALAGLIIKHTKVNALNNEIIEAQEGIPEQSVEQSIVSGYEKIKAYHDGLSIFSPGESLIEDNAEVVMGNDMALNT